MFNFQNIKFLLYNFKIIGIVRSEEQAELNPTLSFAKACGMELHYISREEYRKKNNIDFIEQLRDKFQPCYIIPEGGNNHLGIKGCSEILNGIDKDYDYYAVSCGTGTTAAGMAMSLDKQKELESRNSLDEYRRLAGEAEARAVQARMNMTPAERQATPPWASYDVPWNKLIVR